MMRGSPPTSRHLVGLGPTSLACALVLAVSLTAAAAPPGPGKRVPTPPPVAPAPAENLPMFEAPDPEIERTKAQLDSLRQLVHTVILPIGALLGFLAAGGILVGAVAAVALLRQGRQAARLRELAAASETAAEPRIAEARAAEARAAEARAAAWQAQLIEVAQRTLTLLEESLRLTRQADERTAEAATLRARERVGELEGRARELLAAAALSADPETCVDDLRLRGELADLADEVAMLEGPIMLQAIELPPACLQVKGLHRHQRHEARAALKSFRECAVRATDRDLALLARFWAARELCALGHFVESAETLRRALETEAPGSPRRLELGRLRLESLFFGLAEAATESARPDVTGIVEGLEREIERLRAELPEQSLEHAAVSRRICTTAGDVMAWGARHSTDSSERASLLKKAVGFYELAGDELWARLGWAEASQALGEPVDAALYRQVEELAVGRLSRPLEPRSLPPVHLARLIAQERLQAPLGELEISAGALRAALQGVDRLMTVFSPFERRNVTREAFEAESHQFFREIGERSARPAVSDEVGGLPPDAAKSGPPRYAKVASKTPPRGERSRVRPATH